MTAKFKFDPPPRFQEFLHPFFSSEGQRDSPMTPYEDARRRLDLAEVLLESAYSTFVREDIQRALDSSEYWREQCRLLEPQFQVAPPPESLMGSKAELLAHLGYTPCDDEKLSELAEKGVIATEEIFFGRRSLWRMVILQPETAFNRSDDIKDSTAPDLAT